MRTLYFKQVIIRQTYLLKRITYLFTPNNLTNYTFSTLINKLICEQVNFQYLSPVICIVRTSVLNWVKIVHTLEENKVEEFVKEIFFLSIHKHDRIRCIHDTKHETSLNLCWILDNYVLFKINVNRSYPYESLIRNGHRGQYFFNKLLVYGKFINNTFVALSFIKLMSELGIFK